METLHSEIPDESIDLGQRGGVFQMVFVSARSFKHVQAGCVAAALLAAAGPARAASETVVYAFQGGGDGAGPEAGLIDVGGALYGTTVNGGGAGACEGGCGTVFKVTPGGAESVVYAFKGGGDGAFPFASLINMGGTLYGTTANGGADGDGTVFAVTAPGVDAVMYSFKGGGDGAYPEASLLNVGGALYGTTSGRDAANDDGTVFRVAAGGAESVVYAFKGGDDGAHPDAGLINMGGALFGTTPDGGAVGFGTVFRVTAGGTERAVHAFKGGGGDGAMPFAGLINVGGALYGTTGFHGADGFGTVFAVAADGSYTVVYSFKGAAAGDGYLPAAGLLGVGGKLYGTTEFGGANNLGTVYAVTPAGAETVVYSFQGGRDGAYPKAGLINVGGTLYGTTSGGGASGDGTVFAVTP
jgi:uncharacterized repeat protein (TIGR03803 family)